VNHGDRRTQAEFISADEHYADVLDMEIRKGRWLKAAEVATADRVVVLNQQAKEALFGKEPALGKYILLNEDETHPWKVIGVTGHFKTGGERLAYHCYLLSTTVRAKIHPKLNALSRRKHDIIALNGFFKQAAIAGEHSHRSTIIPGQLVDACVRAVQQAQAVRTGLDFPGAPGLSIDQYLIAEKAIHRVGHINPLVLAVKTAVLNNQRQVKLAGGQAQRGFLIIGNDQQPDQAVVGLRAGATMRVLYPITFKFR